MIVLCSVFVVHKHTRRIIVCCARKRSVHTMVHTPMRNLLAFVHNLTHSHPTNYTLQTTHQIRSRVVLLCRFVHCLFEIAKCYLTPIRATPLIPSHPIPLTPHTPPPPASLVGAGESFKTISQ